MRFRIQLFTLMRIRNRLQKLCRSRFATPYTVQCTVHQCSRNPGPWHFGADPDPWIRTLNFRICILLFSSWPLSCQQKISFFQIYSGTLLNSSVSERFGSHYIGFFHTVAYPNFPNIWPPTVGSLKISSSNPQICDPIFLWFPDWKLPQVSKYLLLL